SRKAVLGGGPVRRIGAGKRASVTVAARPAGLALLEKSPKHRAAGKLTARLRSGQRGLSRAVIVTLT
ncbi:MAG TPA: hypothetical protein VN880_13130, partial [Solirubrobacteraceae bacterium]|nr:hypothetical protein [Solirubrobacteraceae bacterium]